MIFKKNYLPNPKYSYTFSSLFRQEGVGNCEIFEKLSISVNLSGKERNPPFCWRPVIIELNASSELLFVAKFLLRMFLRNFLARSFFIFSFDYVTTSLIATAANHSKEAWKEGGQNRWICVQYAGLLEEIFRYSPNCGMKLSGCEGGYVCQIFE